ncbi:MAG: Fic family protein [Proteobacteria bacterium]|nr:Fic family protein [Pseudomonadota bacterium]
MKKPLIIITNEILKLIAGIDEFKGQWQAIGNLAPDRLEALKRVATIESIGSSTRIEGVKLTDREIEALLSGLETKSFSTRDEEEVAGYAEAMALVYESHNDIPITENHIKQLHKLLLQYSSKDIRHRGEYKKMPNHVEAFSPEGKRLGVVFETATPFETPGEMKSLVDWSNSEFEKEELHPLLIIGVFAVHFLAIHPFQDGNGRLSRILTMLLLLKSGYHYVSYSSLESVIEKNKDKYYLSLRKTQGTFKSEKEDFEPWLTFFLLSLRTQTTILAGKIAREKIMVSLPKLSKQVLELIKEHWELAISDIESMTGENRNTIKVRLRELVKDHYLEKHGTGKGTRYTLAIRGNTK